MDLTLADIKATAKLSDVFYCWLFSDLLRTEVPEPTATVEPRIALMAWIADLFHSIRYPTETVQLVVRQTRSLAELITSEDGPMLSKRGRFQIAIMDGRYLAYTGATSLIDFRSGRPPNLVVIPLESVAYDLAVLMDRKLMEVNTHRVKPQLSVD